MQKLELSPDLFFSNLRTVNRDLCKDAMLGLVHRYDLSGKNVLSLGAGEAFEESWFYNSDCTLTLNDINLSFTPAVCQGSGLTFYHGDAGAALVDIPDGRYDLLYVSSFHPDEIRRETIQADFVAQQTEDQAAHYITWPDDELPYSETLNDALAKIRDGGLVIFQHYRGGVCVDTNPHYIDEIEKQFQSAGVQLLEVYTFRRSTPHLLVVGYKGDASHALEFSKSLQARPEIKTFHGRYGDKEISTDVVKVFELANEHIRPRKVFPNPPTAHAEPQPTPPAAPAGIVERLRSLFRR